MSENIDATKKTCTRCNKTLQISEFQIDKRYKDGYSNWCGICKREYAREYYQKNKETILSKQKEYHKNNKKTKSAKNTKDYKQTKKNVSYKTKKKERDKIRYQNNKQEIQEKQRQYYYANREQRKEYQRKYQKEYYKKNKNKIIAYVCEWQKKHPEIRKLKYERRKLREGCNSYAQDQWYECMSFFDNKCAYSGEDCVPYDTNHVPNSISIDHIIPLSRGGLNVIWNIVPAKFKYNSSKGNKTIEDWYSKQEFFSEDRLHKIYQWAEYAYNKYGTESFNT